MRRGDEVTVRPLWFRGRVLETLWPTGAVLVLNHETNVATWHTPGEVIAEQDEETRRLYEEEK